MRHGDKKTGRQGEKIRGRGRKGTKDGKGRWYGENIDVFRERLDVFRETINVFRERLDVFRKRPDAFR